MFRRATAGKARHRQIETAPEEMHGAAFADEPCAEKLQDAIRLEEHLPKTVRELTIIGAMNRIAAEGDCIRDLGGKLIDLDLDASPSELRHHDFEEAGHRPRFQGQMALPPLAGHNFQHVPIEVKHDLERPILVIDGRGRETARAHIERNMPGMVEPWRESQSHLAHDLRIEMKGFAGFSPLPRLSSRPHLSKVSKRQMFHPLVQISVRLRLNTRLGTNCGLARKHNIGELRPIRTCA